MPLPTPPRNDPLHEAEMAWAEATLRLSRRMHREPEPPCLTVVPSARRYGTGLAVAATAAWCFVRAYHCASQWRLAIEVHPIYGKGVLWACAIGATLAWRAWDRLRLVSGSTG